MKQKIKLLWFSAMAPYDKVSHAGGKTHNFYTKSFSKDLQYDVTLLTYCLYEEEHIVKNEFENIGIKTELVVHPRSYIKKLFWKILNVETVLNPFNRYCGLTRNQTSIRMINKLKKMKRNGYKPDIIILHWTQINLLADKVKRLYPDSKIIEMEVDVTYLGYARRKEMAKTLFQKAFWNYRYSKMKQMELYNLSLADGIIVNNFKDKNLLMHENLEKPIFIWAPFYQSMINLERDTKYLKNNVLFYGAMSRDENWKSAIWFIVNVMPLLEDIDINFVVVGSHPNKRLLNYESKKVHILGYVDDVSAYFKESLCLVAPLLLGAGVKVKIIEGLSSGLPVLTNSIGIEGIPASNNKEYFHCETPQEYADIIRKIYLNKIDTEKISQNSKKLIKDKIDFNADSFKLHKWIAALYYDEVNDAS